MQSGTERAKNDVTFCKYAAHVRHGHTLAIYKEGTWLA